MRLVLEIFSVRCERFVSVRVKHLSFLCLVFIENFKINQHETFQLILYAFSLYVDFCEEHHSLSATYYTVVCIC